MKITVCIISQLTILAQAVFIFLARIMMHTAKHAESAKFGLDNEQSGGARAAGAAPN